MDLKLFLDAPLHLYKRVCLSVGPSVPPSLYPSIHRSVMFSLRRLLGASYAEYSALFSSFVFQELHSCWRGELSLAILDSNVTKRVVENNTEYTAVIVTSYVQLDKAAVANAAAKTPKNHALPANQLAD